MSIPPPIAEIDTKEFRRRLAGLIDPTEQVDPKLKEVQRRNVIRFVATLPQLVGPQIQRITLWNRIGSGLQSALTKTAGNDIEAFVSHVLEHVKARDSAAAASRRLTQLLSDMQHAAAEERQEFLDYLAVHRYAVLNQGREEWERYKAEKAQGLDVSWWGEEIDFETLFADLDEEQEEEVAGKEVSP